MERIADNDKDSAEVNAGVAADAQRLSDEGYALLAEMRYVEAEALLSRACRLNPADPTAYYRLGVVLGDLERTVEALTAYDTALRLRPDDPRAHNNRGSILQRLGRLPEAEDAFRRSMELAPDLAPSYLNLGHLVFARGDRVGAISIYRRAIERGLDASLFQQCIAAASGGTDTTRSPDSWLRATFDNFAPTFDCHLRALGYEVPRKLAEMILCHDAVAANVLDLGCGTGQCGAALFSSSRRITGVDISPRMLSVAAAQGVYQALHESELHIWLRQSSGSQFDVVIAADVFIYIGDLGEIFNGVHRILRSGGLFAFSIEECAEASFQLRPSGRYAQSHDYVAALSAGLFDLVAATPTIIRMEAKTPVAGRLYLLSAAAAAAS